MDVTELLRVLDCAAVDKIGELSTVGMGTIEEAAIEARGPLAALFELERLMDGNVANVFCTGSVVVAVVVTNGRD